MKKLLFVSLVAVTLPVFGQVQTGQVQRGIYGVTRRTLMVAPQIQANQFFAAGGVNVATAGGAGAVQGVTGGFQGQAFPTSGPLVSAPATQIAPAPIVYRGAVATRPAVPASGNRTASSAKSPNESGSTALIKSHWEGEVVVKETKDAKIVAAQ
ncbi:MAG TPA: hypothetical protein VMF06_16905 [Candidatus Limnocylindria bacterium]|jgi:hypothetical protein|nr:hypothetical protein [Candidatus Limnocylindria bacterium]